MTPTQADRDAAVRLFTIIFGNGHSATEALRKADRHIFFDEIAAHRIASQAPLIAEIARKDAALRAIVDLPFTPAPKRQASEIARAALEPVKEADDE